MNLNFTQTGDTVPVSATTSTGNVSLGAAFAAREADIVVSNLGTTWAYVKFGASDVTATSAGFPVPPGTSIILGKPAQATHAAAIMVSGSATIAFTPGQGA